MKKEILLVAFAFTVLDINAQMPTIDPGIKIGNTIWATRNVDEFGTFTNKPEDAGKFYQWNRPTAWAATGSVTGWDNTTPTGTKWEPANNPCPAGWQVPSIAQIDELLDITTDSWISDYYGTGTAGRIFTDGTNSLFFPAAGMRFSDEGLLMNSQNGYYWSSTMYDNQAAYILQFGSNTTKTQVLINTSGKSMRCVKTESKEINTESGVDPGIDINGVIWATRNVGEPNTFVDKPEDTGMLYQWGQSTAWPISGSINKYWDYNPEINFSWTNTNGVCPIGWRLPNEMDFSILVFNCDISWTDNYNESGVTGAIFTHKSNSNELFLPVPGYRRGDTSELINEGIESGYWSQEYNDVINTGNARHLLIFNTNDLYVGSDHSSHRSNGLSVRCVKDINYTSLENISSAEAKKAVAYYSLLGQKLSQEPTRGFYIVVYDNGTSEKIMK